MQISWRTPVRISVEKFELGSHCLIYLAACASSDNELSELLFKHGRELKDLENTYQKAKVDIEMAISMEQQSIGKNSDSAVALVNSKSLQDLNEKHLKDQVALFSAQHREREELLRKAHDVSSQSSSSGHIGIRRRGILNFSFCVFSSIVVYLFIGYRKRGGYRQRQKDAWNNLVMSIWGNKRY